MWGQGDTVAYSGSSISQWPIIWQYGRLGSFFWHFCGGGVVLSKMSSRQMSRGVNSVASTFSSSPPALYTAAVKAEQTQDHPSLYHQPSFSTTAMRSAMVVLRSAISMAISPRSRLEVLSRLLRASVRIMRNGRAQMRSRKPKRGTMISGSSSGGRDWLAVSIQPNRKLWQPQGRPSSRLNSCSAAALSKVARAAGVSGSTATLKPALRAHCFQTDHLLRWMPCLGQYQPSCDSQTTISPSTSSTMALWPEWEPAPYWMIWSTPSKRVMARKSPGCTSASERFTNTSARYFQRKPVDSSMNLTLSRCWQQGVLAPKKGRSGLVPRPPTNSSAVLTMSGRKCSTRSHSRKMWMPHFQTFAIWVWLRFFHTIEVCFRKCSARKLRLAPVPMKYPSLQVALRLPSPASSSRRESVDSRRQLTVTLEKQSSGYFFSSLVWRSVSLPMQATSSPPNLKFLAQFDLSQVSRSVFRVLFLEWPISRSTSPSYSWGSLQLAIRSTTTSSPSSSSARSRVSPCYCTRRQRLVNLAAASPTHSHSINYQYPSLSQHRIIFSRSCPARPQPCSGPSLGRLSLGPCAPSPTPLAAARTCPAPPAGHPPSSRT